MDNKEMLSLAIEDTDILSKKQKAVLNLLCKSDFPVSSVTIENAMQVSRQAIYLTLKVLLDRGFITRTKERVFLYAPNKLKILELIERYKFNISKK
jgi:predicted DNA-binding protein YlxM (UPF0122 family)